MPDGKPAGVRCIHLTSALGCAIFDHPDRPRVCASFQAMREMCGSDASEALAYLTELERATAVVD